GRPNAHLLPVEVARKNFEDTFGALEKPDVHRVVDLTIPTRDGAAIPGRLYLPAEPSAQLPLSVGYRRGPESRFPTAVNDAIDALVWAVGPSADLGVDTRHVAVAGDSAGGNLAAAVALHNRDTPVTRLRHQLLAYPVTTTDLERGMDPEYDGV